MRLKRRYHGLSRRDFLSGLLGTAGLAMLPTCAGSSRPPNIVVLLADDLGYGDLGVHGCTDIPTPCMDAFAMRGVRFSRGYATAPQCAPSRAGLLVGRHQNRFGFVENTWVAEGRGIPPEEKTLATLLKPAGYACGAVGKWHLGYPENSDSYHPLQRGFDFWYGSVRRTPGYRPGTKREIKNPITRNFEKVPMEDEYTRSCAREACDFMETHRDRPFFLYAAFTAPHKPMVAAEEHLNRVIHIKNPKRRTYAALCVALDDAVGCIMAKLRALGLEENTLVFLINDNGADIKSEDYRKNDPLRDGKGSLYEGGIRVMYMMQWKGVLPPGTVYDKPVSTLDVAATALAVANLPRPEKKPLDGVNLLPYLLGEKSGSLHQAIYWCWEKHKAVVQDRWKWMQSADQPAKLYDLAQDLEEKKDLAREHPDRVLALRVLFDQWQASLK